MHWSFVTRFFWRSKFLCVNKWPILTFFDSRSELSSVLSLVTSSWSWIFYFFSLVSCSMNFIFYFSFITHSLWYRFLMNWFSTFRRFISYSSADESTPSLASNILGCPTGFFINLLLRTLFIDCSSKASWGEMCSLCCWVLAFVTDVVSKEFFWVYRISGFSAFC